MANTKQARKRARQAVARNQHLSAQQLDERAYRHQGRSQVDRCW